MEAVAEGLFSALNGLISMLKAIKNLSCEPEVNEFQYAVATSELYKTYSQQTQRIDQEIRKFLAMLHPKIKPVTDLSEDFEVIHIANKLESSLSILLELLKSDFRKELINFPDDFFLRTTQEAKEYYDELCLWKTIS